MHTIRVDRLNNVIRALQESPAPHRFAMHSWSRHIGPVAATIDSIRRGEWTIKKFGDCVPICALGHYAARRDLQQAFGLRTICWESSEDISKHFGISRAHVRELFGPHGCCNTRNIRAAISYIRFFIARELKHTNTDLELEALAA